MFENFGRYRIADGVTSASSSWPENKGEAPRVAHLRPALPSQHLTLNIFTGGSHHTDPLK